MKPWAPIVKWLAIGATVMALLWWAAVAPRMALSEERQAHADTKTAHAEERAEAAEALARSEQQAREMEHRHAVDMERIGREHLEQLSNAQADADRLVADLRAGHVRLQERWRGCGEPPAVPGPFPGTTAPDAVTLDREASAGRIVLAAAECDAHVRSLQEVIRADRMPPR